MNWLALNGDKVCTFVSLSALALQGETSIPAAVLKYCIIAGVLATAAHQSFFPNAPAPAAVPPVK